MSTLPSKETSYSMSLLFPRNSFIVNDCAVPIAYMVSQSLMLRTPVGNSLRSVTMGGAGQKLTLKRFDISKIKSDQVIILLGRRGCGKSYIMRELLSHHADLPTGMVISPTEEANQFYGDMVPGVFIHHDYTTKSLDNLVRRQRQMMKNMNKEIAASGSTSIDPRSFLVMDDCLYDDSWANDPNIKYLFLNGRHIKTMFLITMQYPLGVKPALRANVDYVFVLRENNTKSRKVIYENYAGMFPSYDVFSQVLSQCTNNFECMVIDNTVTANDLTEQISYYKAPSTPAKYRMCRPEYWTLSAQLAKADDEDEDCEVYDIEKFRKSKFQIKVVKK